MKIQCYSWVVVAVFILMYFSFLFSQTPVETYTITNEMSYSVSHITNRAYSSPVATYKDNIYLAYTDPEMRFVMVKKTVDGIVTSSIVTSNITNDTHNGPSIGIDSDGYIHLAGNMHNSAWQYWVSDNPEDISSFTFVGKCQSNSIPHTGISYPCFYADNNGVLYIAYRHIVREKGRRNSRAAGISKYNAHTKKWTALGKKPRS